MNETQYVNYVWESLSLLSLSSHHICKHAHVYMLCTCHAHIHKLITCHAHIQCSAHAMHTYTCSAHAMHTCTSSAHAMHTYTCLAHARHMLLFTCNCNIFISIDYTLYSWKIDCSASVLVSFMPTQHMLESLERLSLSWANASIRWWCRQVSGAFS